jgi:hypothetical protein
MKPPSNDSKLLSRRLFLGSLALGAVGAAAMAAGCGNRCSGNLYESTCPSCQGSGRVCTNKLDGTQIPAPKEGMDLGPQCAPGTGSVCPVCMGKGYRCNL